MFAQLFGSIFGSLLIVSTTRVSATASMRVCVKTDSVRDLRVSTAVSTSKPVKSYHLLSLLPQTTSAMPPVQHQKCCVPPWPFVLQYMAHTLC